MSADTLEFDLTFDLYRRAVALHHGWKRWLVVLAFGLAGALLTLGVGSLFGAATLELLPLGLVFGLAMAFGAASGLKTKARRAYDSNRTLRETLKLEVEDGSYRVTSVSTDVRVTPDRIHDVKEDDRILVVYLATNAFHVVPKDRLRESGLEAPLRTLLAARGV
jgi:hypothetical protein